MKEYLILVVLFISLVMCDELQFKNKPRDVCTRRKLEEYDRENESGHTTKMLRGDIICTHAVAHLVKSVYVAQDFVQLFFVRYDKSFAWNVEARIFSGNFYPKYITETTADQFGRFMKVGAFGKDGELKEVSASFLHFSDCLYEFGYLVSGLNAHEFVIRKSFYWPTGKVRPITDFINEDYHKLLEPEDKLREVVSVALIKLVEKDKAKDHAIYKITLETEGRTKLSRKLVKTYFKVTSKGEVIILNNEPFAPSEEIKTDVDEEAALFHVGDKDELSMGYQFTTEFAFPIYYDYHPEQNTYEEYPMRTRDGFNTKLEKLADRIPYWNRYIVPKSNWLGCPETTFCLGRSFDAVFYKLTEYNAIFENLVYVFDDTTTKLNVILPLSFHRSERCSVDAAFSLRQTDYFIKEDVVYFQTTSLEYVEYKITEVFPGIDANSKFPVSAVIILDKGHGSGKVNTNVRAAETTEEDILKKMVYVYHSNKHGGHVYQFKVETLSSESAPKIPKFKLVAMKPFDEVNAALPKSVSLVFTFEDKVVTMVNHFMIEQSSETFFTQRENTAKFTLIDKYFNCKRELLETGLSQMFLQEYVKFAGPKPGTSVEPDLPVAGEEMKSREPTEASESNSDGHCPKSIDTTSDDSQKVTTTSSSHNSEEVSSTSTENSDLEPSTSSSEGSKTESSSAKNSDKESSENRDEDKNVMKSGTKSVKISSFIQASVMLILFKFCYN